MLQSLTESPEMLSLKELWVYKVGSIYVVIAGNMRLRGSKEKGYKSLPCKILPPETTIEKLKEYAIKDNAGYGDWEMDSLANEWESPKIVEWGVELHGLENGEMPFDETDYSSKNKEIDVDEFADEMIIKLKYTETEYLQVKEQLGKIAQTPEAAVWKLLGNG